MNRLLAAAAADGERELAELMAMANSAGQTVLHRAAVEVEPAQHGQDLGPRWQGRARLARGPRATVA